MNLGNFYKNQKQPNYKKVLKYYELAAIQKNPLAYYNLGILYFEGLYGKPDYEKAKNYFELAAQNKVFPSCVYLGIIYKSLPSQLSGFC